MYRTDRQADGKATPEWLAAAALAILATGPRLDAQPARISTPLTPEEKKATRLVRFLELPDRRSQAIRDLLRMGEGSVSALIRALDDPRTEIVLVCLHMLRELGPVAKDALPKLDALARGKNKELAFAAAWARSRLRLESTGRTLIADYSSGRIREFDDAGKETFSTGGLNGLWDVERLPDGNFLAALYTQHRIVEITAKGKEVWSYKKVRSPLDADRLATGNTLIADTHGNRVIEVDREGKTVWEYASKLQPYDADRLPNGHTLISEYGGGRVIEVDRDGKIVWTFKVSGPFGADRLPNGNTLITSYSGRKVIEVDPAGKVVWELKNLRSPDEARRLPNGHTLVGDGSKIRVFDAKGKELSSIATGRTGTIHRY